MSNTATSVLKDMTTTRSPLNHKPTPSEARCILSFWSHETAAATAKRLGITVNRLHDLRDYMIERGTNSDGIDTIG